MFLDHGVDLEHFTARPESEWPPELRVIPAPRIGYFGSLDDYRVDFDLLEATARRFPDASLVLVGDATCSLERFDRLPNVYWLGPKSYEEVPVFGSSFAVGLMPYLRNEFIRNSNPDQGQGVPGPRPAGRVDRSTGNAPLRGLGARSPTTTSRSWMRWSNAWTAEHRPIRHAAGRPSRTSRGTAAPRSSS